METVISTLGVITVSSIINSITTLSTNVYTLIKNIKVSKNIHNSDIIKLLTKTDVASTIDLLHSVIKEIPEYYINSQSVMMVLKNVNEIIESIEIELKDIHTKIIYNEQLYVMTNWRSYSCKENLDSIELKINILDKRRDNLFKILEVFKNLNIHKIEDKIEEKTEQKTEDDMSKCPF